MRPGPASVGPPGGAQSIIRRARRPAECPIGGCCGDRPSPRLVRPVMPERPIDANGGRTAADVRKRTAIHDDGCPVGDARDDPRRAFDHAVDLRGSDHRDPVGRRLHRRAAAWLSVVGIPANVHPQSPSRGRSGKAASGGGAAREPPRPSSSRRHAARRGRRPRRPLASPPTEYAATAAAPEPASARHHSPQPATVTSPPPPAARARLPSVTHIAKAPPPTRRPRPAMPRRRPTRGCRAVDAPAGAGVDCATVASSPALRRASRPPWDRRAWRCRRGSRCRPRRSCGGCGA